MYFEIKDVFYLRASLFDFVVLDAFTTPTVYFLRSINAPNVNSKKNDAQLIFSLVHIHN